ncbi:MAG: DUF2914 domain-containing protein [Gammaproteobacteria bacterium]|nr:DUF2914 domain-containing protein [Gammaproteobacteria bacterium]
MKLSHIIFAATLGPVIAVAETTGTTSAQTPAAPAAAQQTHSQTQTAPAEATTTPKATSTATTGAKQDVAEQSGFSKGSVVRSIFTSEIKDREPTDKLQNTDNSKVYYFTELRDMNGQTATHRWEHDGKVVAEMKFNVGSNRWRVWSSKSFIPQTAGEYKVSVVNGAGEVISEDNIKISAAAAAAISKAPAKTENAAPAAGVQPAPAAMGKE